MSWKQSVLLVLKGSSLSSGIPLETWESIRSLTAEIPLTELLQQPHNRPEAAALISKIPTLAQEDKTKVADVLIVDLLVPFNEWIWVVDDHTAQKEAYKFQLAFKQKAQVLLSVLKQCVQDGVSSSIAEALSSYSMVTPWCDEQCLSIATEITGYLKVSEEDLRSIVQVIRNNMKTLSTDSKVSQAGYKKINNSQPSALRPKLGFGEVEDSRHTWKRQHIKAIPMTAFLMSQLDKKGIKDHWWLISPTILNVLDDHEALIKLCGVKLLSILLGNVDQDFLQLTGLSQIFYDAMKPLLTYLPDLTPEPISTEIMDTLYPTLLKLFKKTCTEAAYNSKLIELITDGIFFSLNTVRDHISILVCLLIHLQNLMNELKTGCIKVLPRLIYVLGTVISDPFIDVDEALFYEALQCLIALELNCSERIQGHKFDIVGMCVMSWKREKKSERVVMKIRDATVLLDKIAGISDDSWEQLIKFDTDVASLRELVKSTEVKYISK